MEKANYADLAAHKTIHSDFVAKIKGLSTPLSDEVVTFAKKWSVSYSCPATPKAFTNSRNLECLKQFKEADELTHK